MNIIISKATKQLLVPYKGALRELFPNAKTIPHNGCDLAIVPHNPRTQVQLRAAGIETPAPILTHYDWERQTPFETQKTTAALLTSNRRAYCLSDMGVGKTRAALWSWRYLNKVGCANKLLIVAPLSTLRFTWQSEISKIMPDVRVAVLHGDRDHRLKLLNGDYDVFIINHDGLARVVGKEIAARKDIDTLILDEMAVYRNGTSIRSKHMRSFAKRFQWVWALSGRPIPNSPVDAWAQAMILTPHLVPQHFRHAQSTLMVQISQFLWAPRPNAVETAYKWLQPAVRFSLDDVVELPPFISRTIECEFSEPQAKAYRELANYMATLVDEKKITSANAGVAVFKLLQIGAGCVYTTSSDTDTESSKPYAVLDSTPRKEMLLEIIEEAEHKLIVLAPWRSLLTELSKLLTEHKVDHAVIHGGVRHREEIFNDFQSSPRYRLILAHPATLSHGLTLTAATTVVWYSPPLSLETYEQTNARIRRVGQQNRQQYIHLQGSAIERRMYALLRDKQKLQDSFLQLVKDATENNGGS